MHRAIRAFANPRAISDNHSGTMAGSEKKRGPTKEYAERKLRWLLRRSHAQFTFALGQMLEGARCPGIRAADKLVRSRLFPLLDDELCAAVRLLHAEFHLWQGDMPGGWVHAPLTAAKAYLRIGRALEVIRLELASLGVHCRSALPEFPFVLKDRVRWASYSACPETRAELAGFLAEPSSPDPD